MLDRVGAATSPLRPLSLREGGGIVAHLRMSGLALLALLALGSCGDPKTDAKPEPSAASATGTASGKGPLKATPYGSGAVAALAVPELSERERSELISDLDATMAPCADAPVPLSQCIAEKRACAGCKPAGALLARMIHAGAPRADRQAMFTAAFDPKGITKIEIGSAPTKGPADAPITIVEWADFECPYCAIMAVVMDLFNERFPGQIRMVYKYYVLPSHAHAKEAAMAGRAAQNQGKFWEMNELLFANQDKLERPDLVSYAKKVGLDMDKFDADFRDKKTLEFIAADIQAADDLGLDGTPMIYVNGRKLPLDKMNPMLDELEAWLKREIEVAGKTPAEPTPRYHAMLKELKPPPDPAASGSPSAGPSAGPPPSAAPSAGGSAGPASGSATPKK